ncbi:glyoxylate reductase/hydroxypyruvate reductase [Octopus bimaculoides]|uniref:D-isomer specific 2-hydroxyacid dehydrogenase NAD-binding domain-containing protein n=1 Tax=Octopus bimaculoides TaxID=37653 RepID=A0A0L8HYA2_OCTBM|nr:glyoxylate reductase/hydroxypyruvate reductase [Octopus bimaculoides]|eukprot:XP_014768357.1 PREDICTED: glyoxylate reductase/hydroxypyruvate reductase-like [Octopus bimaculoides]
MTWHLNMAMQIKPSVLICLRTVNNTKLRSNLTETCLSRLRNHFQVNFLDDIQQNPNIKKDIVGIVTPGPDSNVINRLITTLPNLRVISNHGMGVDHLDLKWAKEKGLRVGNTRYVVSDSTAELAITLILVVTRKIVQGVRMSMENEHPNFFCPSLLGTNVAKKNLGIVGMGDIGLKIALRATAFGMKILYHNRTQRSNEDEDRVKATFYPRLQDMLPEADVLVIACPCTEQTINLISTEEFRLMKKTSLLVNIARGKIVNTDALVKALQSNEIQSAALDVTDPEPLPRGHPLLSMPNVVITTHCGTYTYETRLEMIDLVIENLKCGLEGKVMPSEVIL